MSLSDDPGPKLRSTSHHRHAHTIQPLRLPEYLTHHPHAIAAFHTLLVAPPVIAVALWGVGWYGSPEWGEWGTLRGKSGGEGRFGGMGWCQGNEGSKCTVSPWFDVPDEFLPASAPAFLPSLLTLLNVIPAPMVLTWWTARYLPRLFSHLRVLSHNHNLPSSSSSRRLVPSFKPYKWFETLEPWWINLISLYVVLVVFVSVGLLVWIKADAGLGWSFALAGNLTFVAWRALRGKYEGMVDDVRDELAEEMYERARRKGREA